MLMQVAEEEEKGWKGEGGDKELRDTVVLLPLDQLNHPHT